LGAVLIPIQVLSLLQYVVHSYDPPNPQKSTHTPPRNPVFILFLPTFIVLVLVFLLFFLLFLPKAGKLAFPFPLPASSYALEDGPASGITAEPFNGDVGPGPKVGGLVVVCNSGGGRPWDVLDRALSPPPRPPGAALLNISGEIVRESARLLLLKLCGDVANPAADGADVP